MVTPLTIAVIGGGAAGFFGSIIAAQSNPCSRVLLLEKSRQLLSKVRISGGGRCNVTHACFDPKILATHYPRGGKALLGPFGRFQPRDMIKWLESNGVALKVEDDGRMFPVTDSSETIIDCLVSQAKANKVEILTESGIEAIRKTDSGFILGLRGDQELFCDRLLLATGSNSKIWQWLKTLGHTILDPVPSLFTFNVPESSLSELAGVSVLKVSLKIKDTSLKQTGPILVTHWGFSGPAVLKLSAWGARILHEKKYCAHLQIDWLPDSTHEEVRSQLLAIKKNHPARLVVNEGLADLPRNLWKKIVERAGGSKELRWAMLPNSLLHRLLDGLKCDGYEIQGKTTHKEEFVTCGGIDLSEVDFKTMQSKVCPNLYFAGEILDIDGVTGGFNFQNAWTTAWIAGHSIGKLVH